MSFQPLTNILKYSVCSLLTTIIQLNSGLPLFYYEKLSLMLCREVSLFKVSSRLVLWPTMLKLLFNNEEVFNKLWFTFENQYSNWVKIERWSANLGKYSEFLNLQSAGSYEQVNYFLWGNLRIKTEMNMFKWNVLRKALSKIFEACVCDLFACEEIETHIL